MGRGTPTVAAGLNLVALVWLSILAISSYAQTTPALNITAVLAKYPQFSVLSDLLVSSGVEKEVNARKSITILAPSNAVLNAFTATVPNADSVKLADLVRIHVLLQYFSVTELKGLGTANYTSVTTLYQTTGRATGQAGFINIFNTPDQILIGPAVADSNANATVVGTVVEDPYDLSIIEIDAVLKPAGFDATEKDLIKVLESFQTFSLLISYLQATGVDAILAQRQTNGGFTYFAPTDSAFSSLNGSIESLSLNRRKLLLEYHALTSYYTLDNLQTMTDTPVQTLASTLGGGYRMNISAGIIKTGVNNATITQTLYNANPVTLYATGEVLRPTELFGTPDELSPAEAPTPDVAPAPSPKKAPTSAPAPKSTVTGPAQEPSTPVVDPSAASVVHISSALSAVLLVVSATMAFF